MNALLRKDLRIYRGAIVAAVVAICLPYIILTGVELVHQVFDIGGDLVRGVERLPLYVQGRALWWRGYLADAPLPLNGGTGAAIFWR